MNALLLTVALLGQVDYPLIVVRSARPDDVTLVRFPEVFNAVTHPPSDLVRRLPDGTLQVVVAGNGARLFDPKLSLDGQWLYYVRSDNTKSDIYRTNGTTTVRLTDAATGVFNLGPQPLPGGKVAYTSNRRGFVPIKGYTAHNEQLHVLDDIPGETDHNGEADRNVECTGFLNLGAALHPTLLTDGRIMWSTNESQGLHDKRTWGLWVSYPDGRQWKPIHSAFAGPGAWHFQTQLSDKSIITELYYNLNNNGLGAFYGTPWEVAMPEFLSPVARDNPPLPNPLNAYGKTWISTMRRGTYAVTPFTGPEDVKAAKDAEGNYMGKVAYPAGAPGNDLLCSWSPGPSNLLYDPKTPMFHFQVGVIRGVATTPQDIDILLDDPAFNWTQAIYDGPWTDIYGELPPEIPFNPNPTGTPFGIVGSSSAHIGQWKPRNPEPVWWNLHQGHWTGADVDETGADLSKTPAAIEILAQEPNRPGAKPWTNIINERLRVIARIPFNEPDRPQGDTSWSAKIPADTSFTFATVDASGRMNSIAQTWHQVRPGEVRRDCGGCHNHSGQEIPWAGSYADGKPPFDFRSFQVKTPEFNRDVLPILQEKCYGCHDPATNPPVKLDYATMSGVLAQPLDGYSFGAKASRLSRAIHGEGTTAQMPLDGPPLTAEERLKFDEWLDTFCLQGDAPDDTPPTVYVPRSGTLNIGAYDYLSGLTSVVATHNGQPLTLPAPVDGVYQTGVTLAAGDRVEVTATDGAGRVTNVQRYVRGTVEPPPPPVEPPTLEERVEDLERRVTELENAQP